MFKNEGSYAKLVGWNQSPDMIRFFIAVIRTELVQARRMADADDLEKAERTICNVMDRIAGRHGLVISEPGTVAISRTAKGLYMNWMGVGKGLGLHALSSVERMRDSAVFDHVSAAADALGDYQDYLLVRGALANLFHARGIAVVKSRIGLPPEVFKWKTGSERRLMHLQRPKQ